MLRGLSPKYRHAIPTITKDPPHTFLSTRSYLLLEEQYDKESTKIVAQRALMATGGSNPSSSQPPSSPPAMATPTPMAAVPILLPRATALHLATTTTAAGRGAAAVMGVLHPTLPPDHRPVHRLAHGLLA